MRACVRVGKGRWGRVQPEVGPPPTRPLQQHLREYYLDQVGHVDVDVALAQASLVYPLWCLSQPTLCVRVCVCVCVRVCGRVGVWVCGCVGVWVCGCVGVYGERCSEGEWELVRDGVRVYE